ncbi:tRNA (5-methylaminomethyl-2-thiouridine)(34)-methyltransferase MnmD [Cyanobium sp. CH-040]|uniref:tRNA (5-methylaminomethyl-2-thiouridine)(34)-methyltransferase MnmD n=1 Tax=Cyanobium sp. CH-040 TaxID=2823708 RepID=UPI0020CBFD85|nr:MnmC family methyltransferase [Cyanobium sp. CH-040]MCP9926827.1 SAM-dependent methyltransferase [Cyanobium sp. CH-040]
MTSNGCGPEAGPTPADGTPALRIQSGADGSFSLFSNRFGEGFHGTIGALSEARAKFVRPAQLERFSAGQRLVVVDVGFGLGTNSAALLEAASGQGLTLQILGLELDPQPLRQALACAAFRRQWQPGTLAMLWALLERGGWCADGSQARLLWGDARSRVGGLLERHQLAGRCDLVLLDAFSPRRCPELWSLEFLSALARLLRPEGRLLTYCCAAAVRHSLQLAGLQLASIRPPQELGTMAPSQRIRPWSFGTAASPTALGLGSGPDCPLQPLTTMEIEHLGTRAAQPYRDPSGQAAAAVILAERQLAQAASAAASTSAWRRRWGLEGHPRTGAEPPRQPA